MVGFSVSFVFDFSVFWGVLDFSFSFLFDYVSLGFFSVVSLIAGVVLFYRGFYMLGSSTISRFCYLVVLFVFSMMVLVFSGNLFSLIVGWDGLGLVSFCLVIYYLSPISTDSGLITVYRNRFGDVAFIISFFFFVEGIVFMQDFFSYSFSWFFCFLLFFSSITKRAQIPFSAWLPAAMAAPTPVSSLVHSSTLVTAGVFVMIRYNFVFLYYG